MAIMKDTKIEEELTCCFKTDLRNFTNFDLSTWKSKKFVLIGSLRPKYIYIVWATKVQRSCLSWHWRDMQILKKNWLENWFEKRLEKFVKFSPEHLKVSKLGLWWDPFVQSRKGMTLKFTEELCVMTMKNNAKFEEELTCHFKTDMRNLTNFDSSTQKSNWFLWPKYIIFELRKVQCSYVWWH